MAKPTKSPDGNDKDVTALLERYGCPVPFHAVRTRFMGNIASPGVQTSPIQMVEALWGGELPTFGSLDAADELLGTLVMGLWNRLTRHQERSAPFRLTRIEVAATREGIAQVALTRREELDGFVEGLFGAQEELDLPERAHQALEVLAGARAMLDAAHALAIDPSKPVESAEAAVTLKHFRELTRIAEHEIHEAVLACTRARRQFLDMWPATRPTVH